METLPVIMVAVSMYIPFEATQPLPTIASTETLLILMVAAPGRFPLLQAAKPLPTIASTETLLLTMVAASR